MTTKTEMPDWAAWATVMSGVIVLLFGLILFDAFALQIMWGWFVVPLGVPPVGLAHAYGVFLLWLLFKPIRVREGDVWKSMGKRIVRTLLVLGLGWIVQGFM